MTEPPSSYRRILQSSSIIGGASVISILVGLVRTKVLAVLLGPAGVGLAGLFTALLMAASSMASMGIGTVGTREVAEAAGRTDEKALRVIRRTMFLGTLLLAGLGASVVWLLRDVLALHVLGDIQQSSMVAWLALGVALSVASASQSALIQGMRRIGDMARLSVYGSIAHTIIGVAILWQWGETGLIAYILVGPAVSFLLGHWYVAKLPPIPASTVAHCDVVQQGKKLLKLGAAFMAAGLAATLANLWIRVEIGNVLGIEAVGYFLAASTICTQYVGIILGAMAADYYPRLTAVVQDPVAATRMVNEQTEIALLLAMPILILMMALAPWVIQLLYAPSFLPAAEVMRLYLIGDLFKMASWPLGFVILAGGRGKTFLFTELFSLLVMLSVFVILVPRYGLPAAGIAFVASTIAYLPMVYWIAKKQIGMTWRPAVLLDLFKGLVLMLIAYLLVKQAPWGGYMASLIVLPILFFNTRKLLKITSAGEVNLKIDRLLQHIRKLLNRSR